MVMSAQGLPATSRTLPLNAASSYAAARGAIAQMKAVTSSATYNHELFPRKRCAVHPEAVPSQRDVEALHFDSLMLDSPFVTGRLLPESPGPACALLSLIRAGFQAQQAQLAATFGRYGIGSATPASANAFSLNKQLSQTPHAVSSLW